MLWSTHSRRSVLTTRSAIALSIPDKPPAGQAARQQEAEAAAEKAA